MQSLLRERNSLCQFLNASYLVYNDKGSKQAVKDLKKLERNFKAAGKKIAKAFGVATLAAGALAVKIGKDGIQAAIKAQAEQNRLEQILLNTNGASKEQVAVLVEQAKAARTTRCCFRRQCVSCSITTCNL
jgi:hypothetical protein